MRSTSFQVLSLNHLAARESETDFLAACGRLDSEPDTFTERHSLLALRFRLRLTFCLCATVCAHSQITRGIVPATTRILSSNVSGTPRNRSQSRPLRSTCGSPITAATAGLVARCRTYWAWMLESTTAGSALRMIVDLLQGHSTDSSAAIVMRSAGCVVLTHRFPPIGY